MQLSNKYGGVFLTYRGVSVDSIVTNTKATILRMSLRWHKKRWISYIIWFAKWDVL